MPATLRSPPPPPSASSWPCPASQPGLPGSGADLGSPRSSDGWLVRWVSPCLSPASSTTRAQNKVPFEPGAARVRAGRGQIRAPAHQAHVCHVGAMHVWWPSPGLLPVLPSSPVAVQAPGPHLPGAGQSPVGGAGRPSSTFHRPGWVQPLVCALELAGAAAPAHSDLSPGSSPGRRGRSHLVSKAHRPRGGSALRASCLLCRGTLGLWCRR